MSQRQIDGFDVEVASEKLDEKGRNTYIITREEGRYGFYMAGPGLGTYHSDHNDLIDDYATSSEETVESLGALNFGRGEVIFVSDNFRSGMNIEQMNDWDWYDELEAEILESVEEKVDTEFDLETVKWR